MITELTPEQEAMLPVIRDEWIAHGLSTEPANREEAERGVEMAYKAGGVTMPKQIIWADSPLAGARLAAEPSRSKEAVRAVMQEAIFGQHEAPWLSFYDVWRRFGIDVSPLDGVTLVAKNAGWWWAFDDKVILTDRPCELHRDADGRLHNPMGAALLYRDGWGLYRINGFRVNKEIVTNPESITTAQVWAESNAEVRRIMIDQMGWDRFVDEAALKLISEAPDPGNDPNTVRLYSLPEKVYDEPVNVLLVTNASPDRTGIYRRYGLTVPADVTDALAAAAWLAGVDRETYSQLGRAT